MYVVVVFSRCAMKEKLIGISEFIGQEGKSRRNNDGNKEHSQGLQKKC